MKHLTQSRENAKKNEFVQDPNRIVSRVFLGFSRLRGFA